MITNPSAEEIATKIVACTGDLGHTTCLEYKNEIVRALHAYSNSRLEEAAQVAETFGFSIVSQLNSVTDRECEEMAKDALKNVADEIRALKPPPPPRRTHEHRTSL